MKRHRDTQTKRKSSRACCVCVCVCVCVDSLTAKKEMIIVAAVDSLPRPTLDLQTSCSNGATPYTCVVSERAGFLGFDTVRF